MRELLIRIKIDDNENIIDAVIKKGFKGKIFELAGIYAFLMQKELNKVPLKRRKTI